MCICCTGDADGGIKMKPKNIIWRSILSNFAISFATQQQTNRFCCCYGFLLCVCSKTYTFSAGSVTLCVCVCARSSIQSSAFFDIIFTLLFCTVVFTSVIHFVFRCCGTVRNIYFDYSVISFALITNCLNAIHSQLLIKRNMNTQVAIDKAFFVLLFFRNVRSVFVVVVTTKLTIPKSSLPSLLSSRFSEQFTEQCTILRSMNENKQIYELLSHVKRYQKLPNHIPIEK